MIIFEKKLWKLNSLALSQVENSDSCQYLQTEQYRASCKQGAMLVLDSW